MMVREWFPEWAASLIDRSGRADWPEIGSEFWDDFQRSLVRAGATWPIAEEALSLTLDLSGLYPSDYRGKILEQIRSLKAKQAAGSSGCEAGSREEAERMSAGCPDCEGSGQTTRFVHSDLLDTLTPKSGGEYPIGTRLGFFCGCHLGRWMARRNIKPGDSKPPKTVADVPVLAIGDVPWSDRPDNRYRHRPEHWDSLNDRPIDFDPAPMLGTLPKHLAERLGRQLRVDGPRPGAPGPHSAHFRPSWPKRDDLPAF